ncbi:MAG: ribosome modulation factor [Sphingomonadales bacterium]|jgi:ribosome modulation factor|nr:ribosome modulation factor [Sphingomonadales bacterium]
MANPTDRAWSEGHKAGANGKADTASPYKKGMAHQAWMQGWEAGAKLRDARNG